MMGTPQPVQGIFIGVTVERKPYQIIYGDELFRIPKDSKRYLIEGILGERDYITIVAEPKMGKTILAQQMACSISSGKDFLDVYNVSKSGNVWYFATEGRDDDLKDRFMRINKMVELNKDNLHLIPCHFRFNTPIGRKSLDEIKLLLVKKPPIAIFIDALYMAIAGSLTKDEVVNDFHHQMSLLQNEFRCAIITVHHMRKPSKDSKTGKVIDLTDRDMYGSTFLLGGVDHCLWIENYKATNNKMDKIIKCDSQRSGGIIDSVRVKLKQPEPLGFEIVSKHIEEKERIVELLSFVYPKGYTIDELEGKLQKGRSTLYIIKKELDNEGLLGYSKKEGSSQILWHIKKKDTP